MPFTLKLIFRLAQQKKVIIVFSGQTKVCPKRKNEMHSKIKQSISGAKRESISSLIPKQNLHFKDVFTYPPATWMVQAHYEHIPYSTTIN